MSYDHIQDTDIKKTLETYKSKLDSCKKNELDISQYKVEKPWGYEIWLEVNEYYAYKLISMKQGMRSSLQSHEKKYETNFIIDGEAEVLLEDDKGVMRSFIYKAGQGWSVPIGRKHRVIATTDYVALECSTPHLDDVIRYSDDSHRTSGKIEQEHKQNGS